MRSPLLPSAQIYRELQEDVGVAPASHGCLRAWSAQGVLLLNAVLSVRAGERQSHAKRGWETFTDAVVQRLASRRDGLVFLLWGRAAQERGRHHGSTDRATTATPKPAPRSLACPTAPGRWRLPDCRIAARWCLTVCRMPGGACPVAYPRRLRCPRAPAPLRL
jgi:hypothetical protein